MSASDPNKVFSEWHNEWITDEKYVKVVLNKLIIPIYPKIRLSIVKIYDKFMDCREIALKEGCNSSLFLINVNKYKKELLNKNIEDKREILMKSFPKYMWVVRALDEGESAFDYVYDATSLFVTEPMSLIVYQ